MMQQAGGSGTASGSRASRVRKTARHRRAVRAGRRNPATVEAVPDPPACCHHFRLLCRAGIKLMRHYLATFRVDTA